MRNKPSNYIYEKENVASFQFVIGVQSLRGKTVSFVDFSEGYSSISHIF